VKEAKKALDDIRSKKGKIDTPLRAEIENILKEYYISSAAYHGGQLNGVCCRCLMDKSRDTFDVIENMLLQSPAHDSKCSDDEIKTTCKLFRSVCSTLDRISSKLRIKYGAATDQDFQEA
jgi:hypothetical protein